MSKIALLLLFLVIPFLIEGQILPKEGSKLNYRLIGFSFPGSVKTGTCTIEIAEGVFTADSLFDKKIIKHIACTSNRIIAEVPLFGKEYTWRTVFSGEHVKES